MSKSLGNGIDPLDIVSEFGADALKFTLAFMCAQGQDILVDSESFKLGSRFANKIWNASRYILGNLEERKIVKVPRESLSELDRWIWHRFDVASENVRSALEGYRYNDGAQTLYEFFWNDFCDWYVEATKLSFKFGDEAEKDRAVSVLLSVLEASLRLLHPYLPFVSEEIYRFLPGDCAEGASPKAEMLIAAAYPEPTALRRDLSAEARFTSLQELVRSVRALRAECGIDPATKIRLALALTAGTDAEVAREKTDIIQLLAGVSDITFIATASEKPKGAIGTVGKGFEAFVIAGEGVDATQLVSRFEREIEKEKKNLERTEAKLGNANFTAHAPAEVVEAEREKIAETKRRIAKLGSYVKDLQ